MQGTVGVLNVGAGDTKLSFDKDNPVERIRAARIVADMIRRGYVLLIASKADNGEMVYRRAKSFDENTCEYIIADLDPVAAAAADQEQGDLTNEPIDEAGSNAAEASGGEASQPAREPKRRGRPPTKRVDAGTVHAVAVGPRAGG